MNTTASSVEILSKVNNDDYPEIWYEIADDDHFWFYGRFRAFTNQLIDLKISLTDPHHCFEIGCGHGVVRRQMELFTAWTTDGADINLVPLKMNNTTRGRTMVYDIFDKEPSMKQSYDSIMLFDVIEHIVNPAAFIQAALFHLKPNGFVFINVPAFHLLHTRYDDAVGHYRRYDKSMMQEVFNQCGLETLDLRYWGFSATLLVLLRKLVTPRNLTNDEVVRRGFRPPSQFINQIMRKVAQFETRFVRQPPFGTSLIAVARYVQK